MQGLPSPHLDADLAWERMRAVLQKERSVLPPLTEISPEEWAAQRQIFIWHLPQQLRRRRLPVKLPTQEITEEGVKHGGKK